MSGLGDWIIRYLQHLRHELQPDASDRRFQQAARLAQHNGWEPDQVAQRINAGDYTRARSPVVIALIELERVAEDKPPTDVDTIPPPGCGDCRYGWIDDPDKPVTRPCPTCRPQLAARLAAIPPPGKRGDGHQAYIRTKRTMR